MKGQKKTCAHITNSSSNSIRFTPKCSRNNFGNSTLVPTSNAATAGTGLSMSTFDGDDGDDDGAPIVVVKHTTNHDELQKDSRKECTPCGGGSAAVAMTN